MMLRLIRFGADLLTAVASGMYLAAEHMQGWDAPDGLTDELWNAENAREKKL